MDFDSDKAELVRFLEFLQKKEIDMVTYRNLFGALSRAYPKENLPEKFQHVVQSLGTEVRHQYAPLLEQVRNSTNPQDILDALLRGIRARKK